MRVAVSGASGLIGSRLVAALAAHGDEVTALSRDPDRARERLGVEVVAWRPEDEPAPAAGLSGRHGVVHLADEPIAQRWSKDAKKRMAAREPGTRLASRGPAHASARKPASSAERTDSSSHARMASGQKPRSCWRVCCSTR